MKKLFAILLSITCVLTLVACSSDSNKEETTETETTSQKTTNKKTLVVYYSATGNTKEVANYIATATQGDLFEIIPKQSYSDEDLDYTNEESRVSREHENESERNVELEKTMVDNWSDYDTIFIGYPIWWGIAAWPVNGFVQSNDFTGKTVIPFATSASSGLGESGDLLAKLAGTGDWQEGQRFSSGADEDSVKKWLSDLGL